MFYWDQVKVAISLHFDKLVATLTFCHLLETYDETPNYLLSVFEIDGNKRLHRLLFVNRSHFLDEP